MFPTSTVATYTCERGFELLGPARRQCQADGTWTPEGVPFCGNFLFYDPGSKIGNQWWGIKDLRFEYRD